MKQKKWLYERRMWFILTCLVCSVLHALYVIRLGGGFMHARLLLPFLFGFLMPFAVVRLPPIFRWKWPVILQWTCIGLVFVWSLGTSLFLRVSYEKKIGSHGIEEPGFHLTMTDSNHPITPEDYAQFFGIQKGNELRALTSDLQKSESFQVPILLLSGPDWPGWNVENKLEAYRPYLFPARPSPVSSSTVLINSHINIGLLGYVAGPRVHIVDLLGLSDPIGSRLLLRQRGRPGHEKRLTWEWVYARYVKPNHGPLDQRESVRAARQTLSCPPLSRLLNAITKPMTLERFFLNIAIAVQFHTLRIPSDPLEARKSLCR